MNTITEIASTMLIEQALAVKRQERQTCERRPNWYVIEFYAIENLYLVLRKVLLSAISLCICSMRLSGIAALTMLFKSFCIVASRSRRFSCSIGHMKVILGLKPKEIYIERFPVLHLPFHLYCFKCG